MLQIVVRAPSGAVLGHVQTSGRAYSSSGWLDVFDADHNLVYTIQGQHACLHTTQEAYTAYYSSRCILYISCMYLKLLCSVQA